MRSSFGGSTRRSTAKSSSRTILKETYDLKGLNMIAPGQVMPDGETPYSINFRRYADNDSETSVAIRTRNGCTSLSTPVGEAVNVQDVATVTGDIAITPTTIIAVPFTAASAGVLTMFKPHVKKTANARGYLIINICQDSIGLPGASIAQSSIAPSLVTTSYADVAARFIDAPTIADATQYWAVFTMQELGAGGYYLAKTGTGTIHTSTDGGATWMATTDAVRFKAYTSTAGTILGFTKRYPETAASVSLAAFGTSVYQITDAGVPTVVDSAVVHATSPAVRFFTIDERTFWVDQVNPARWWNGTTAVAVPGVPSTSGNPFLGCIFQNRALWVPLGDRTRVEFSALYDFVTYPSVNFFYIGLPNSQDWITAWHEFREGLTIFTKETKWTLTGSDISTFSPNPHKGTKGAVSMEATVVGAGRIFFMADDKNIYSWDGANDKLLSKKVSRELKQILDTDKVRFAFYDNKLRVYYNKNPDTTVKYMLLYDVVEDQWYADTGKPLAGGLEWVHNDNELVEFSSRCLWMIKGETGYSDIGKAIDFKYWTSYDPMSSGAAKDRIKRFRPVIRPADSSYYMSIGKDVDFQNTPQMKRYLVDSGGTKWGTFNWGDGTVYGSSSLVDNKIALSGRGKHTQFRFEHESIDQPVFLLGYIALISQGRPR